MSLWSKSTEVRATRLFAILALTVLALLILQLFFAGLVLFGSSGSWAPHRTAGWLIFLPVVLLLILAYSKARLRGFRRLSAWLFFLSLLQPLLIAIGKAIDAPTIQSLHAERCEGDRLGVRRSPMSARVQDFASPRPIELVCKTLSS